MMEIREVWKRERIPVRLTFLLRYIVHQATSPELLKPRWISSAFSSGPSGWRLFGLRRSNKPWSDSSCPHQTVWPPPSNCLSHPHSTSATQQEHEFSTFWIMQNTKFLFSYFPFLVLWSTAWIVKSQTSTYECKSQPNSDLSTNICLLNDWLIVQINKCFHQSITCTTTDFVSNLTGGLQTISVSLTLFLWPEFEMVLSLCALLAVGKKNITIWTRYFILKNLVNK